MVYVAALQKLKLQICMLCMRLKDGVCGCPPETETACLHVVYETKMMYVAALQKLKLQVCMLCMRLRWCMWLSSRS